MKNLIQILKSNSLVLAVLPTLLFTAFIFTSCSNAKPEDPKEVAEERNEEKFDDNSQEKDAEFLVWVAEMNLEQVQLGKLAQANGINSEVKKLGAMMEAEHSKVMDELKGLASKKQISIPATLTDDGQDSNEKLLDKKDNKFDKKYCDMMVDKHEDAIKKFEKASSNANDADIREWAFATIPALRKHLESSINCQKQFEKL